MKTFTLAVFVFIVALVAVVCGPRGRAVADVGLVQSNSGAPTAISTAAPVGTIQLQGQGYCSVVIAGSPVGLTAVPQTSGDSGATWQTASNIGSGSISSAGTYSGGIVASGNGITMFRLNVTAYTSGSTTYVLSCGPQTSATFNGTVTAAVSPIPLPVSPPTCPGVPNAPCVQITGQPTVQVSAAPSPIPIATASPGGFPVHQVYLNGSGSSIFLAAISDSEAKQNIATATTTTLVAGIAGENTYVFYAGTQATGTNSGATINFEWGTGAACSSVVGTLLPAALGAGTASPQATTVYGGSTVLATSSGIIPAQTPFVLPTGDYFCALSAGTTIAYTAVVLYAQH